MIRGSEKYTVCSIEEERERKKEKAKQGENRII